MIINANVWTAPCLFYDWLMLACPLTRMYTVPHHEWYRVTSLTGFFLSFCWLNLINEWGVRGFNMYESVWVWIKYSRLSQKIFDTASKVILGAKVTPNHGSRQSSLHACIIELLNSDHLSIPACLTGIYSPLLLSFSKAPRGLYCRVEVRATRMMWIPSICPLASHDHSIWPCTYSQLGVI